jgi:poly(3-hydroxybutyrate) depolymerase
MKFIPWAAIAAIAIHIGAVDAAPLPPLNIDPSQTTVSGISSGGYMAVQLHIAYSARFAKGAAVIAGGPFNCAEGSIMNALGRCFGKAPIPVAELIAITEQWGKDGLIDPTGNLAGSKVYLFSAANDSVVKESTSTSLLAYYQHFLAAGNITYKNDIKGEHGFITDDHGKACLSKEMPFIINCNFDLAGALLQQLYADLAPRNPGALAGNLSEFDQSTFVSAHGMGASGWVFVPKACATGSVCRLHVALHGCKQSSIDIGEEFVRNAGYNRWADSNNIVVLYPQTGKGAINSCWDWWGYDDANYAKKSAPQMKAIMAMVDRLGAGSPGK